ncbi:uncharacterized protein LOC111386575 isoform X1 [Olea europaea var. sylvestris]|uniref:Nuclear transcription factor Y subunit A-7 n=1 Tax=Olea europaea subsp. europaea TaxID=158383 RepID=A0A8S0P9R3_OLEEU|nr:uncharacterized protein LOC111386575 isoform X1 [Olea europaea var. sylvestris]CAA2934435.1 nuclear transcription factor Y subunit A-7 [Olea europaea subsp. europaea]
MTSAVLTLSDNSEAYEQQKYSEPQIQSNATSHSGTAFPNMNYAMPAQLSAENAVPYLDESRQLHAVRRAREGGQFKRKSENQQQEYESGEESQANLNLNSDKKDPTSSENGS